MSAGLILGASLGAGTQDCSGKLRSTVF